MNRRHLIVLPMLLLCFSASALSQDKLGHLKSWDGKTTQEVAGNGKMYFSDASGVYKLALATP